MEWLMELLARKPIPVCSDCMWHSREAGGMGLWVNDICNHPKKRVVQFDPVKGSKSFAPICGRQNGFGDPCSRRGQLFEPKEV
jgi:hypothetical protein